MLNQYHKPQTPDGVIRQRVAQQLTRRGVRPPSHVDVSVSKGAVTLSGQIEFEMQRKAAVHAATAVDGVHRVVDHMTVIRSTVGGWHSRQS